MTYFCENAIIQIVPNNQHMICTIVSDKRHSNVICPEMRAGKAEALEW